QPAPGLAVRAGVGRAGRQAAGRPPGTEAGHRLATRSVGVEDLREEDPQGHQRAEEPLAVANVLFAQGTLDLVGAEQIGKRQARRLGETTLQGLNLAGLPGRGTLSHGRPPCGEGSVTPFTLASQAIRLKLRSYKPLRPKSAPFTPDPFCLPCALPAYPPVEPAGHPKSPGMNPGARRTNKSYPNG